jgi:DNA-binding NarL/FixJ family response regulator
MVNAKDKISVLVVDDHPPFAQGLAALLTQESDMKTVGIAYNGEDALKLADDLGPDVVVTDVSMPGISGVEATRRIKAKHPDIIVLILSAYGYEPYLRAAMGAGAAGYLLKSVPMRDLVNAIRSLCAGETVLDRALAEKIFRSVAGPSGGAANRSLDESDLGLLRLSVLGLGNKDIANRLHLSERTVQSRFASVFSKLGVASRVEAILKALKEGWLSVDDLP